MQPIKQHTERRNIMGYKIKELRDAKRMTQEELAAKSGVSRTIISLLENNSTHSTSTKTLVKLATALGVTVDQIFFGDCV